MCGGCRWTRETSREHVTELVARFLNFLTSDRFRAGGINTVLKKVLKVGSRRAEKGVKQGVKSAFFPPFSPIPRNVSAYVVPKSHRAHRKHCIMPSPGPAVLPL
jgi:hypothetical protein